MATITSLTSRPWAGPDDSRAIAALLSAAWAGPRRPLLPYTTGDLAWWTAGAGPDADLASRIRIWELGGVPAGAGWMNPPASLDCFVVDGLTAAEAGAIRDSILDWLADSARATRLAGPADANSPGIELETWAADGWPEQAALVERGWEPTDTILTHYFQTLDMELDPPRVPDGYTLRSLRGPEDFPARVEAHRAAFAPSKMSVEKHAIAAAQDPYALERDIVVEAADGSFAAFAICWADPIGAVGTFEPVGVHPDHQRRGLGQVIMRHGLRLMRAAGLRDAVVFSLRSNQASEALYRSAGFHEIAIHRQYTKRLDG